MRSDLTDITVLLDRSGSMERCSSDTIGGFNAFIKGQRNAQGSANVTLSQFDHVFEDVYVAKDVKDAPLLTSDTFKPRGSTALYYSICRLIDETGKRLSELKDSDMPGLVIFVIITDGEENFSHSFEMSDGVKYSSVEVNHRIELQRDVYKWQFIFIGANQDAIASAKVLGISPKNSLTYGQTPIGTHAVYDSLNLNVSVARGHALKSDLTSAKASLAWTDEQRKKQDDEVAKKLTFINPRNAGR